MRHDFLHPFCLSSHQRHCSARKWLLTMPAKMAAPILVHLEENLAKTDYLLTLLWLLWDHMHGAGWDSHGGDLLKA